MFVPQQNAKILERGTETYLQEAGGLVERLHRAVADGQVARVGVGDDDLQCGGVHVPQVDVGLLALAEAAHEHCSAVQTQAVSSAGQHGLIIIIIIIASQNIVIK